MNPVTQVDESRFGREDMREPKSDYIESRAGILRLLEIQGDNNELNEAFDVSGSSLLLISFLQLRKAAKKREKSINPGPFIINHES